LDWQDRALCAQTDPEAFFPEKGGSTREAKKVCRGCEVQAEGLEDALEHDERFGIWGGLAERERRRLKRETCGAAAPFPPAGGGPGQVARCFPPGWGLAVCLPGRHGFAYCSRGAPAAPGAGGWSPGVSGR